MTAAAHSPKPTMQLRRLRGGAYSQYNEYGNKIIRYELQDEAFIGYTVSVLHHDPKQAVASNSAKQEYWELVVIERGSITLWTAQNASFTSRHAVEQEAMRQLLRVAREDIAEDAK